MPGFCGSCGTPRVEGARFCTACGASVASTPEPCPTCGQMWTPPPGFSPALLASAAVAPQAPTSFAPQPATTPSAVFAPAPSVPGLPRGPLPGQDYRPGLDCGNCGMELQENVERCSVCGTANTGAEFRPGMLG